MGERQRIYIGGLDPNRGLTVELVASRLQSVKGVEIDMISDGNNPKHTLIDEDGDLVDTRNFFYIEARATDKESQSSALDLLAKQYHNAKWKGCLLRVEEAKPHFLKRLEQEREERAAAAAAALSVGTEEPQAKANVAEEGTKEVKQRRRLRIRQRFGEEAFHVDTHPRQIQLGNGSSEGWTDFAFLRNRMIEKREAQRKNLMERRKQERRSWAGGKSNKEVAPSESDLRSLIFLNRGIHIRFDSLEATDLTSDGSLKDVIEDDESSSCPSSSDSDESSIQGEDNHQKSYVWSDDDDDEVDDSANVLEDENHLSSESEEDEENEVAVRRVKSDSDDDSTDNKQRLLNTVKDRNLKGDAEYTKAVVADEFSFGADFDFTLNTDDDTESVRSDNADTFNESLDIKLEDDISSNINILSKLFPRDNFDSKPLAESINKIDNSNGEENSREKQKFGAGLIMQRYDPTKDADKIFEKVDTKAIKAKEEIKEKQDEGQSEEQSVPDDASLSSESSERLSANETEAQKEKEEETAIDTEVLPSTEAMTEESRDVYEQDKLEDVFKQSRQAASTASATGGFSFGFQVPSANPPSNSFSFGFSISDEPKVEENTSIDVPPTKKSDEVDDVDNVNKKRKTPARETRRVRRVGPTIPERDLDAYEDLFFSMNEGHQILKDLDAMKQDEDSQNLWQTERAQLTSDWKRKQKAAQSRRVKKIRR